MRYVNNFSELLTNSAGNLTDMAVFNVKLKFHDTYDIPTYSLPYLINGDVDGLDDTDIAAIEEWLQSIGGEVTIDCSGSSSYFSSDPAFGLPADCEECDVYVSVADDEEIDDSYTPKRVMDEERGGWKWDERRGSWADARNSDDDADDDF
jgi:hypothetical protein